MKRRRKYGKNFVKKNSKTQSGEEKNRQPYGGKLQPTNHAKRGHQHSH